MPEDGQYCRNVQHMLSGIIKFVVAERQYVCEFIILHVFPSANSKSSSLNLLHISQLRINRRQADKKCSVSRFFKSGVKIRPSLLILTPDAGRFLSKQDSNMILGDPYLLTLNKSQCLSLCGLKQLSSIFLNHIYLLLSLQTRNIFLGA